MSSWGNCQSFTRLGLRFKKQTLATTDKAQNTSTAAPALAAAEPIKESNPSALSAYAAQSAAAPSSGSGQGSGPLQLKANASESFAKAAAQRKADSPASPQQAQSVAGNFRKAVAQFAESAPSTSVNTPSRMPLQLKVAGEDEKEGAGQNVVANMIGAGNQNSEGGEDEKEGAKKKVLRQVVNAMAGNSGGAGEDLKDGAAQEVIAQVAGNVGAGNSNGAGEDVKDDGNNANVQAIIGATNTRSAGDDGKDGAEEEAPEQEVGEQLAQIITGAGNSGGAGEDLKEGGNQEQDQNEQESQDDSKDNWRINFNSPAT